MDTRRRRHTVSATYIDEIDEYIADIQSAGEFQAAPTLRRWTPIGFTPLSWRRLDDSYGDCSLMHGMIYSGDLSEVGTYESRYNLMENFMRQHYRLRDKPEWFIEVCELIFQYFWNQRRERLMDGARDAAFAPVPAETLTALRRAFDGLVRTVYSDAAPPAAPSMLNALIGLISHPIDGGHLPGGALDAFFARLVAAGTDTERAPDGDRSFVALVARIRTAAARGKGLIFADDTAEYTGVDLYSQGQTGGGVPFEGHMIHYTGIAGDVMIWANQMQTPVDETAAAAVDDAPSSRAPSPVQDVIIYDDADAPAESKGLPSPGIVVLEGGLDDDVRSFVRGGDDIGPDEASDDGDDDDSDDELPLLVGGDFFDLDGLPGFITDALRSFDTGDGADDAASDHSGSYTTVGSDAAGGDDDDGDAGLSRSWWTEKELLSWITTAPASRAVSPVLFDEEQPDRKSSSSSSSSTSSEAAASSSSSFSFTFGDDQAEQEPASALSLSSRSSPSSSASALDTHDRCPASPLPPPTAPVPIPTRNARLEAFRQTRHRTAAVPA